MTLPDHLIRSFINQGDQISIDPYFPENVQPCSLDFTLDRHFLVPTLVTNEDEWPEPKIIHPGENNIDYYQPYTVERGNTFILQPGKFVLGSTYEVLRLGNRIRALVNGKSTLGRLGIIVHATAGFVDPGFHGHITLEIYNLLPNPVMLIPGMRIGQFEFCELPSPCSIPYGDTRLGSHYQGQRGPTPPRGHLNWRVHDVFSDPLRNDLVIKRVPEEEGRYDIAYEVRG